MLSHVQLFATSWTVACHAPLVHGTPQTRILEWVAISFSRGSSQPRDQPRVSCIAGRLPSEPSGKPTCFTKSKLNLSSCLAEPACCAVIYFTPVFPCTRMCFTSFLRLILVRCYLIIWSLKEFAFFISIMNLLTIFKYLFLSYKVLVFI